MLGCPSSPSTRTSPPPDFRALRKHYSFELGFQKTEFTLPELTAEALRDATAAIAGTHGLDGWTAEELALLPLAWWNQTVHMFNRIEEGSLLWPDLPLEASASLIPKEDSYLPSPIAPSPSSLSSTGGGLRSGIST